MCRRLFYTILIYDASSLGYFAASYVKILCLLAIIGVTNANGP